MISSSTTLRPWQRRLLIFSVIVILGSLLHGLIQFSTPYFADSNDSFYRAKMAEMILQNGIVQEFPWLYFTTLHKNFVNHHLLFHVVLIPFIVLGKLFSPTPDLGIIVGAKSAIVLMIGLMMGVFYLLLDHFKVKYWGLWILFLSAVPYDFYFRLHMVRVQSLSLLVMLLGLWALFEKRYKLLGLLSFLYVTLYGGAFFLPIFVLIYVGVYYLRNKKILMLPLLWSFGGLLLGYVTDPYFFKVFGFLKQQIFETGLGYQKTDLNVGGEWRPYDTWYIFQMGMATFLLQISAVTWVLLRGLKQNTKSITVFLISLFFLVLMWKSKRFVEYWPAFAVLSSAYLLRDELQKITLQSKQFFLTLFGGMALFFLGDYMINLKPFAQNLQRLSGTIPQKDILLFLSGTLFLVILLGLIVYYIQEIRQKKGTSQISTLLIALLTLTLPMVAYQNFTLVKRDIRPDTSYITGAENMMTCIKTQGKAQKGDIIMTDDWDIFPLFFFYNHTNNYIVGLDPVFMYNYDKVLYKQFADITIGTDGQDLPRKIKELFKAKFVVLDRSHTQFQANIESFPESFEKICENQEFKGYRVL